MRFLRLALLCLLVAAAPAALAQTIDYDRLDQRLTRLSAHEDIVGLSVAVIENGEIRFAKGYGVTEIGGPPVTDETVFRWASLSKGVAASQVAILAGEARLNLSDTVSKFKTSLRLPGGGESQATLEDVLSHRLGIVSNAYDTSLEDGGDPTEIRNSLRGLKPICTIGECHTYQNVAFDAVAEVVEQVTNSKYADAVDASLFKPLGMITASIDRAGLEASQSWARPYTKREKDAGPPRAKTVNDDYYRVPAAGGVNGSIRDLALYARAQMGLVPDVLSDTALEMMQTPRIYTSREQSGLSRRYKGHMRDARYALGWRVYKYGDAGTRVIGHRGAVEGYRSLILFDPERDTGVVALWNSSSRLPVGIGFEVMDMAYNLPAQDWMGIDAESAGGGK
ncbi:MAG: serine hydrolase domain-containing protein [Hyphomonas sp.]